MQSNFRAEEGGVAEKNECEELLKSGVFVPLCPETDMNA